MDTTVKLCLDSELKFSKIMIIKGLSELQNEVFNQEFYPISLLLLSNGFERIIKCLLCLNYMEENNKLIKGKCPYDKRRGHDLKYLLDELVRICKEKRHGQRFPANKKDIEFFTGDINLKNIISLLSDFGMGARYYNLDIISQGRSRYKDPKTVWSDIKLFIYKKKYNKDDEYKKGELDQINFKVNQILISSLEQFARSLARIFTLGEFGSIGKQIAYNLYVFLTLMDQDLGKNNWKKILESDLKSVK